MSNTYNLFFRRAGGGPAGGRGFFNPGACRSIAGGGMFSLAVNSEEETSCLVSKFLTSCLRVRTGDGVGWGSWPTAKTASPLLFVEPLVTKRGS